MLRLTLCWQLTTRCEKAEGSAGRRRGRELESIGGIMDGGAERPPRNSRQATFSVPTSTPPLGRCISPPTCLCWTDCVCRFPQRGGCLRTERAHRSDSSPAAYMSLCVSSSLPVPPPAARHDTIIFYTGYWVAEMQLVSSLWLSSLIR